MTHTVADQSSAAAVPQSLAGRAIGILTSPRATYAGVAAHPRWLGALLLILVVSTTCLFAFLSTDIGRNAVLDQQVRQAEAFSGHPMTDAQYDRVQQMLPYSRYFAVGAQCVTLPLTALLIAGIAFAVFTALLGGDATFKQTFAIVVHSGMVLTVSQLFMTPLNYARETMSSATSLAVFAPFLDDASFPARVLGSIDLFILWWAISFAIGLGVLYKKRTGPIATGLILVYVAIGVIIAAFKSAVAGA
jgi:Yip1-like protein